MGDFVKMLKTQQSKMQAAIIMVLTLVQIKGPK